MKNPIQKFRKSSIVFEKTGILSEKLKILTSSNYHRVQNFLGGVYKQVFWILFILFISRVICKNKNGPGFYALTETTFFTFLLITQNLNKIKKTPEHSFEDIIVKQRTWAKFQQKMLNSMAVGDHQSFPFFRRAIQSLGDNRALLILRYRVFHFLISDTHMEGLVLY